MMNTGSYGLAQSLTLLAVMALAMALLPAASNTALAETAGP